MVPEGSHVRSVYLTPETGVLAAQDLGSKILIDCSTIDTGTSLQVAEQCSQAHPKARFYDSPVSGGVIGAEKGTLTFMLGCRPNDDHIDLLTSILSLMGTNIFPAGGPSLGLTAKLCNNYLSGSIAIATAEALDIGMKSGMDPRVWRISSTRVRRRVRFWMIGIPYRGCVRMRRRVRGTRGVLGCS